MQQKLLKIYQIMLKTYGKQGWWPTTPPGKLMPIYSGGPKTEQQQLEIIFGALLTQNTAWKNVEKALICLNKNKLIDIDKILAIKHEKLAECIKSSGYHNQKAERLKIICKFLKLTPIKELKKLDVQTLREILLKIKGIGPETADSIILYAFNKPTFVIDTYTKRIISRIGFCKKEIKYENLQELFMKTLYTSNKTNDTKLFNEYHALLVEHAKRYCNVKAKCGDCILKQECKKLI
jgi:endonuclease III related protein